MAATASLCEACGVRPYVTNRVLGAEPVNLCEECLAAVVSVLEDEADY
jgi:hypothetical protein